MDIRWLLHDHSVMEYIARIPVKSEKVWDILGINLSLHQERCFLILKEYCGDCFRFGIVGILGGSKIDW